MFEPSFKRFAAVLEGCCTNGNNKGALWHFIENLRFSPNCREDYRVVCDAIKFCANLSDIRLGGALHSCAVRLGHVSCHAVSKSLLNLYAKSGEFDSCKKLFRQMDNNDPVVWNIVLAGLACFWVYDLEVIRLFNSMRIKCETKPNPVTFAIILPVLARCGNLYLGKSLHSCAIKFGLDSHTLVGNALVSLYAKCGLVRYDGYAAFDSIFEKDVVSWNAIIAGFSENKRMDDAFGLFRLMLRGAIEPNYATFANILPVCSSLDVDSAYCFGREIQCYIWRRYELKNDVSVCNALLSFYLRVGRINEAVTLFRRMDSRDLVTWNAIITGHASTGECFEAVCLFLELVHEVKAKADSITVVSILPACAQLKNLKLGKEIHCYVLRHFWFSETTSIGNALVSFYAKCGCIQAAYWTFSMISDKDLVTWNSILNAFAESQYHAQFLDLFHQMLDEGSCPDSVTVLAIINFCTNVVIEEKVKETHGLSTKTGFLMNGAEPTVRNALLNAHAKCGNMEYAFKIFQGLSGEGNLVTYNSMISGYVNCGNCDDAEILFKNMSITNLTSWNLMVRSYAENHFPDQAICLFHEMQTKGMKPDAVTIMSILPVCSQIASLHMLRQCHAYAVRSGFGDVCLKGAILDIYAKCGSISSAHRLFLSDPHKDLVMFTAMVSGYAMHGMGKEALMVFSSMLAFGIRPDHVIMTAVLSACSHAGLVDEGLKIFYSIEKFHLMKPTMEQYACAVDMLSRRGRINDAYSLVTAMPIDANANIWATLLGACRTHHDAELGRLVADRLFEVESDNVGNYILMSNLYAADSRWDRVLEVRKLVRTRDLKKPAGCSWIEVEGKRNAFIAGDYCHPLRSTIIYTLESLDQQIKEPLQFGLIEI